MRMLTTLKWKLTMSFLYRRRSEKRFIPALKIGKLAVCQDVKSIGLGTLIINYIEWTFLKNRRARCRFITVDALREAEGFYSKNYFKPLIMPSPEDETILMYFDLKKIA